ncbi:hypothetical protein CPB84DRAFT_1219552 [Gymnopilus junonius]|uniref:Uncharacterized protein n=1 Tax=Gymnopilus junonius TaxID=109634 RepID=A0A9P5NZA9_GYMJU|nr:hypothetical protein CPB84DRAFT_1219552 [Gymnopilus junonius]
MTPDHLSCVMPILAAKKSMDRPKGALIVAFQLAYRAIARWSSGKYEELPRPYCYFSGDNWVDSEKHDPSSFPADLQLFTAQGKKPTREIERLIEMLEEQQWKKIIETASTFSRRSRKKNRSRDSSEGVTTAENGGAKGAAGGEESGFELEDNAMNVDKPL